MKPIFLVAFKPERYKTILSSYVDKHKIMQTIHPVSQTAGTLHAPRFTHSWRCRQEATPSFPIPVNRPCVLPRLDGLSSGPSCLPTQVSQGCSCHSSDGEGCPPSSWVANGQCVSLSKFPFIRPPVTLMTSLELDHVCKPANSVTLRGSRG